DICHARLLAIGCCFALSGDSRSAIPLPKLPASTQNAGPDRIVGSDHAVWAASYGVHLSVWPWDTESSGVTDFRFGDGRLEAPPGHLERTRRIRGGPEIAASQT